MRFCLSLILCCGLAVGVLIACGSDGGGDEPKPTTNVSGTWVMAGLNMQEATLTQCTGDLEPLNGWTIADMVAVTECMYSPLLATQRGTTFTFFPADYDCINGNYGYLTGGGSVSNDFVSCQLNTVSEYNGDTVTAYHSGNMTGPSTIVMSNSQMDISGNSQGECLISPAYRTTVTIVRNDGGGCDISGMVNRANCEDGCEVLVDCGEYPGTINECADECVAYSDTVRQCLCACDTDDGCGAFPVCVDACTI